MGPDPVVTHGSTRTTPDPAARNPHRSRESRPPRCCLRGPAVDRSLAHRAELNIGSPMRRCRVDMAAATRRHWFRQLCGNSRSTLRQLCGNCSGRVEGVDHGCFRPIGDAARGVAVQGLSGCGQLCVNSWSTLRQGSNAKLRPTNRNERPVTAMPATHHPDTVGNPPAGSGTAFREPRSLVDRCSTIRSWINSTGS